MTDVIGWGDVDDVADPPRRRRRPPRWVVAILAVLVIAGAVAVPPVRAHLSRDAAGWLAATWNTRSQYDDARAAVVQRAAASAGIADGRLVGNITRAMDVAEATRLEQMADSISGHRTWSGDVATAARAAVAALRSEAAALRNDANAPVPTVGFFDDQPSDSLIGIADKAVAAAATRHHAAKPRTHAVSLPEPTALLNELSRPTDRPTGLGISLHLSNGRSLLLDLDTGKRRPLPRMVGPAYPLAGRLVGATFHEAFIYDPRSGRTRVVATGRYVQVTGVDHAGMWVVGARGIRRFSPTGEPEGTWHPAPAPQAYIGQASGDAALVFEPDGYSSHPVLWYPSSGRQVRLPGVCMGDLTTGAGRFVFMPCGNGDVATIVDSATARRTTVHLPGSYELGGQQSDISPDGSQLALQVDRGVMKAAVVDLVTGKVTYAPGPTDLTPVSWSQDGQWLLLADPDFGSSSGPPRVALWHVSGPRELLSVRFPANLPAPRGPLALVSLH